MKTQDLDRLSAYIDHQLSPSETAALEQRLGREPELRAALSELRLTVKAVRSLPMVKPPRRFTLTAAQVGAPAGGRPRRTSLFGTLRLAATLSALALVLVVGGDFAASRGAFGPAAVPAQDMVFTTTENSAAGAAAQEEALTATPEAEMSIMAAEAETPTLSPEEAPAGDGAPAPEATAEVSALMAPATPTPTLTTERMAEATQVAEVPPDADETATGEQLDAAELTPSTKVVPAEATDLYYATEAGDAASTAAPGFSTLRLLEAALAMLTVLLGLGTWFASRNA